MVMTSPSPASVEPITVADRDADIRPILDLLNGKLGMCVVDWDELRRLIRAYGDARVVELEAALAKYRCPLGMENGSDTCSAGSCPECLASRLAAEKALRQSETTKRKVMDRRAIEAEARATALLEALQVFAAAADTYEPPEGDDKQTLWNTRLTIGDLRVARAAISAGASNDRK